MTEWNKPAWYLTPQEFAEIIINSLEDNNYFKRDEKAHPVDIESAFSTTASAVAHAIDAVGKNIHNAEKPKKKALVMPTNLQKDIVVTSSDNITTTESSVSFSPSYTSDVGYLEHKYGKTKK
jgi:chaperonin GroEL (HSP60 family)